MVSERDHGDDLLQQGEANQSRRDLHANFFGTITNTATGETFRDHATFTGDQRSGQGDDDGQRHRATTTSWAVRDRSSPRSATRSW